MAGRDPQPGAWLPYAGMLLAIGGVVYTAGTVGGQVKTNTDRIVKLEASDAARSDGLNAINVRTARMEAKLDMLMPDARRDQLQNGPGR